MIFQKVWSLSVKFKSFWEIFTFTWTFFVYCALDKLRNNFVRCSCLRTKNLLSFPRHFWTASFCLSFVAFWVVFVQDEWIFLEITFCYSLSFNVSKFCFCFEFRTESCELKIKSKACKATKLCQILFKFKFPDNFYSGKFREISSWITRVVFPGQK